MDCLWMCVWWCVWKRKKSQGCVGGCRSGRACRAAPQQVWLSARPYSIKHSGRLNENQLGVGGHEGRWRKLGGLGMTRGERSGMVA